MREPLGRHFRRVYYNYKHVTAILLLGVHSRQTIPSSQPFLVSFIPLSYLLP